MEFKKIKYSKKNGVELTYKKQNPKGDSEESILKNKDNPPMDSFTDALQALVKDVKRFLPFLDGTEDDSIDLRSVSFSHDKNENTQVIFSVCINVDLNSPVNISSPLINCSFSDDGERGLYDQGGQDRINKITHEAIRYMEGHRQNVQLTIPGLKEASDEPLEDPVKKSTKKQPVLVK